MVINMEVFYPQDRPQEIWHKINSLHLSYLEMEESPQKMEQRNKLEDCITEFLYMAPHDRKFYLRDTAEVLHRSASSKVDFSGYKGVVAWNAIGRYAGNLLSQPWREEYRTIKTYCGFYKHQIEANLVGAEVMFEAMGYKYYRDGILVLDGPICPDRVTQVSQDSIVAYVECQILKAIWEQVSTNFTVSWLDVLEFRETHLGGPKQAVQALNYRFHQRQYQEQRCYSQGSEHFHGTARYPSAVHHSAPILSTNHSFPPLSGHMHMQAPPTPFCIYPHNGYYSSYGPMPQNYPHCTVPFTYPHPLIKPQYPTNGYCYANGYPPPATGYTYPVPTGQLIELEHTYDVPDGPTNRKSSLSQAVEINRNKNESDYRINNNTDKEEGSGTFESWDYVYRNLESQGYSKDLGERGDLTKERSSGVKESKQLKASDLEEALANLAIVADKPLKINEGIEKHKAISKPKEQEKRNIVITPSSSYDNLSGNETNNKKQLTTQNTTANRISATISSKTLPKEKADNLKISKATSSKTMDHRKSTKSNDLDKYKNKESKVKVNGNNNNNNESKWNCSTCTYLNNCNDDICQMCFKSKATVNQDMEVGGSECSHCTLVNPKNCKKCEACDHPLKNSPTYI